MRLFSKEASITFACDPHLKGVIPDPLPASEVTPKWYRKMALGFDSGLRGTVKRCIPFKDSMDMGYILPLWVDINVTNDGKVVSFSYANDVIKPTFEDHDPRQITGCPLFDTTYGNQPMKFINPWLITTPPGWSCMFIQPINHFDGRLHIITGVVDTDKYKSKVNFPFIWMDKEFNGVMTQGTPLVQVIPFKRSLFSHNVRACTIKENNENARINTKVNSVFKNAYRLNWWSPKRYK